MSVHTEAHKRRRDAAYERGYADALEAAAKVADAEREMREQLFAENEASINAHKAVQAEVIAAAIRNLRSAG